MIGWWKVPPPASATPSLRPSSRKEAAATDRVERPYRERAEAGDFHALARLARIRERTGDQKDAERMYRAATDHGDTMGLLCLALRRRWPYGLDPDGTPTPPWW